MNYLLDTNVFYDLESRALKEERVSSLGKLFISPWSILEILFSSRSSFEQKRGVAKIVVRMLNNYLFILPNELYVSTKHFVIQCRNVADKTPYQLLYEYISLISILPTSEEEVFTQKTSKFKKLYTDYILKKQNDFLNTKEKITYFFSGRIKDKLRDENLSNYREHMNLSLEKYKINYCSDLLSTINKVYKLNLNTDQLQFVPRTLKPYVDIYFEYISDSIVGRKPKVTDYVDLLHFLYLNVSVDKIATNDQRPWVRLAEEANVRQYLLITSSEIKE